MFCCRGFAVVLVSVVFLTLGCGGGGNGSGQQQLNATKLTLANYLDWFSVKDVNINKENIGNILDFVASHINLGGDIEEFFDNSQKSETAVYLNFIGNLIEIKYTGYSWFATIPKEPNVTLPLRTLEFQYAAVNESAWNEIGSFFSSLGCKSFDFSNDTFTTGSDHINRALAFLLLITSVRDGFNYFTKTREELPSDLKLPKDVPMYYFRFRLSTTS